MYFFVFIFMFRLLVLWLWMYRGRWANKRVVFPAFMNEKKNESICVPYILYFILRIIVLLDPPTLKLKIKVKYTLLIFSSNMHFVDASPAIVGSSKISYTIEPLVPLSKTGAHNRSVSTSNHFNNSLFRLAWNVHCFRGWFSQCIL